MFDNFVKLCTYTIVEGVVYGVFSESFLKQYVIVIIPTVALFKFELLAFLL